MRVVSCTPTQRHNPNRVSGNGRILIHFFSAASAQIAVFSARVKIVPILPWPSNLQKESWQEIDDEGMKARTIASFLIQLRCLRPTYQLWVQIQNRGAGASDSEADMQARLPPLDQGD
jgi:hypothetical protein